MKTNFLKTVILENKRRRAVVLLSVVCLILVALTLAAAQVKTQKRITALQLGDAAEGARVTIVSDSALNDYEAFRRGDRFYVRIPLADFTSIPPSFRADGFEDVQVQKVGDSLLVSFRLQPGASAHVDQGVNRLDVIFSAPNRTLRNRLATGSTVGASSRNPLDRGPDAAGPMPPGTVPAYSRSTSSYGSGQVYGVTESRNSRLPFNPSANGNRGGSNQFGNQPGNQSSSRSTFGSGAVKSASPLASPLASPFATPSSLLNPSSSGSFPPATSATPATSGSYQPTYGASPAGPAVASGTSSWKTRGEAMMGAAMKWISANRLATLLAILIFVALIVYLVMALGRRRRNQAKAKRLKAPKVQPKIQPNEPMQPTVRSHVEPYSPLANSQPRESSGPRPSAQPSASVQDRPWVLTRPSINSPAGTGNASSEEQEREVFEL